MQYFVKTGDLNQRVDIFLKTKMPDFSRHYLQKLIKAQKVSLNGRFVSAGDRLKAEGLLNVDYQIPSQPPTLKLSILFEDEFLIVINKPEGLLTHAKNKYWEEATVASALRQHCRWPTLRFPGSLPELRRGLVHRLDRQTSGVMVVAKDHAVQQALQEQFAKRSVDKVYLAATKSRTSLPDEGLIDKPLIRARGHKNHFTVSQQGRLAQTYFKIKRTTGDYHLLELRPKTGRTHQLRVHLASVHHPIVGDMLYGGEPAERLMLHALNLEFRHPRRDQVISCQAPLPDIFNQILNQS